MSFDEIREVLADVNPEAILWDGFEDALIGMGERCGMVPVAIYDYTIMIAILVADDMTEEDAREHIDYNVLGSWVGEHTPIIVYLYKEVYV